MEKTIFLDFCCDLNSLAGTFTLRIDDESREFKFTAANGGNTVPCQITKIRPDGVEESTPFVHFVTYGENFHLRDAEVERLKTVSRPRNLLLKLFSRCIKQISTSHAYFNGHVAMLDKIKAIKFRQVIRETKEFVVDITDAEMDELFA